MNRTRPWALAIPLGLALILGLIHWRLAGPAPASAAAPATAFSAERAYDVLHELLREGVPHPVGSRANMVVRDRIVERLRSYGYQPTIQRAFACSRRPTCATVENIVAIPAGTGDVVLLVAHYDSVAAGPGASDDGSGVAVLLECARALRGDTRIGFLITDGEEAGLLGAEAFVRQPAPRPVRAIVNVEHRGTSGPSYLFETSRGNASLIAAAARSLTRPFASSLFYTVYDLMPNDTDVTVFKRADLQAANFAAIGNVAVYHTAHDNLENVDRSTMQHHGDNALALARELAKSPLPAPQGNAVYFDVLGFFVVRWPESWSIWIAIVSLVVLLVGLRARAESPRYIMLGVGAFVAAVAIAALAGFAIAWLSHWRAGGRLTFPQPAIIAAWIAGIAAAFAFVKPRTEGGVALAWHIVAIALILTLPGISFLFLVPAIVMSIGILFRAEAAASIAAAILIFPLGVVLYTALGKTSLVAIAALMAIFATTFAFVMPLGRKTIAISAAGALVLAAATAFLPIRARAVPPAQKLEKPTVTVSGVRADNKVTINVTSTRNADRVSVRFEDEIKVVRVNGFPTDVMSRGVNVYGASATIEVTSDAAVNVTAVDLTWPATTSETTAKY